MSTACLDGLADSQIPDELLEIEATRRALEIRETALIDQVIHRNLAFSSGAKNTVQFLRTLLRIGAADAAGREYLARAVCPRRTLTGEPVEAAHPQTAEAFTAGEISAAAALTVVRTVDTLPECVLDEAHPAVEKVLLDSARELDPHTLRRHARAIWQALDQDGALADAKKAERARDLHLTRRADGTGRLTGVLTCELAEYVHTLLDTFAKPRPAEDGTKDARTVGQRNHDALLTGLKLLFTSGRLPSAAGCATTVVLRMDVEDFVTGQGVARTGHGYSIPMQLAKTWLDAETRAILVLLSKTKGIQAYSSVQRLFTEQQRLAMLARDGGCSFPDCDATLAWTDAHHVTDFRDTNRTCVDDGALVCGKDHDTFEAMGWRSVMIDGHPHWVPPAKLDPGRKPRRNRLHDRPRL